MDSLLTAPNLVALLTLTALEIVLGIDNIVFISILAGRLPEGQRERARVVGLALAMISRILLLLSLTWIMRLTRPFFGVAGREFSGRDIILLVGGLFLLAKSTHEIHVSLESEEKGRKARAVRGFLSVVLQIMVLDIVFSLDSVITAVGLARHVEIMIVAIVAAVIIMMISVNGIARFIEKHPTIKMLALSFLLLIGVTLMAESFGVHIPKGYVYFAMAFSLFVELLNQRLRQRRDAPVHLRKSLS
jgi:predicted tellurium resistance membrane protein TerC